MNYKGYEIRIWEDDDAGTSRSQAIKLKKGAGGSSSLWCDVLREATPDMNIHQQIQRPVLMRTHPQDFTSLGITEGTPEERCVAAAKIWIDRQPPGDPESDLARVIFFRKVLTRTSDYIGIWDQPIHHLHVFGGMGEMVCYMNVSLDEARSRYLAEHDTYVWGEKDPPLKTIAFTDKLMVYDIEQES